MTSFRSAFRVATQFAVIAAGTIAGDNVEIERDWAVPDDKLPAISLSVPRYRYEDRSEGIGVSQFWSTIWLRVECRLGKTDREALVFQLDTLTDQIEATMVQFIIGPPQIFRRIVGEEAELNFDATGANQIVAADLTFGFEYANDAEAQITDRLVQVCARFVKDARIGQPAIGKRLIDILAGANILIPQPSL